MISMKHFGRRALQAKLPALRAKGRKAFLFLVPFYIVGGGLLAALPTPKASALTGNPPTLRWLDSATIEASGGDLKGTYKIVDQASKDPSMAFNGATDITHKDGCQINLDVGVPAGTNGQQTDWSKAMMWPTAANSGTNCFTNPVYKGNDFSIYYEMGIVNGQLYPVGDTANRSKDGQQQPPPVVDDPTDKQIINVALYPGWATVYTTPNPSSPPKQSDLVPQQDLWVLCGNANDPTKGWDAYRNNLGTPDYNQMETDCLARKDGFVISTARGDIQTSSSDPKIKYTGQFTGVTYGYYVVCDFITNSCQDVQKEAAKILTVDQWKLPANPTAQVPDSSTDASGTVNEPVVACDVTFDLTKIFSLKWLVCPIVNTATYAVGKLEDVINSLLTVNTSDIFNDTSADNAYHKAWNSFRAFALGLIVIAALIMVVSQAIGVEILDAYTVRKVLPRLLFAAIFIALSWDILEFLTNLSNDAGVGIRTLIYAPFQALNKNNQLGGGSQFVLTLIGTGAALAFGWVGLLSFALTGLLAAMVAFSILVLRKILILLLIMMAPFAIACYILPNTQKGWTIWKDGLLSVLIVFPIISAIIAIGRVFSITAFNSNAAYNGPGGQTVNQLIAVIAYFAPYFLISMAFRLAGGFIGTVGGMVNDRSKGAFDRLKNFRGNKVNENMSKMAEGRRFQNSNPLARTFNSATGGVGTYARSNSKIGFLFNKNTREAAFAQQRLKNQMAYSKSENAQVAAENDPLLRAQTYASESEARAHMANDFGMGAEDVEKGISAAKANGGFGRAQQDYAARRLLATGTGYDNIKQVHETVARVAGTNQQQASDILGYINGDANKYYRSDLKTGYGAHMKLYRKATGQAQAGDYDGMSMDDAYEAATMDAIKGNETTTILRSKPMAVKNMMPVLARALQGSQAQVTQFEAEASRQTAIANDTSLTQDVRDVATRATADAMNKAYDARKESGRLSGIVEQLQQSGMYASAASIQTVNELTVQPTINIRQQVQQEGSRVVMARDPVTNRMVPVPDAATGKAIPNATRNRAYTAGLEEQAPRSGGDPRNTGIL